MIRSAKKTDLSANTIFNSFTWNNIYNQNILQNEYTKIILIETKFFKISRKFIKKKKKTTQLGILTKKEKKKLLKDFTMAFQKRKRNKG